jgi:hypothetical protein
LAALERALENAAFVPVPDALPARVLLARARRRRRFAAAGACAGTCAVCALLASVIAEAPVFSHTLQAVGPAHPAVIAIAEVAHAETRAIARAADSQAALEEILARVGLTLMPGEVTAYYAGKCYIADRAECEHIVLSTPDTHANVMLMPHYPLRERLLVKSGKRVALVSPVGDGGYIVVADSPETARRFEKLIVVKG